MSTRAGSVKHALYSVLRQDNATYDMTKYGNK